MQLNTYQKTAIASVGATLFLIFVGGLVRAAGAGLGCPDWPTCFGLWIPPTSVAELPSQFDASQFNPFKTWLEYLNRVIGVIIGLLITATFWLSFRYREKEPEVFYSSAAAFLLVIVQGWLGGQVVMTGLDEWLITLHMVLAMIIMALLLYAAFKATSYQISIAMKEETRRWMLWAAAGLLTVTLVQLIFGTQVREAVDVIKNRLSHSPRELWLEQVGLIDEIHRSFSWMVGIFAAAVLYLSVWKNRSPLIQNAGIIIFALVIFQILLGAGLTYLGMPPAYQVFHLSGAAFLIAFEIILLLLLNVPEERSPKTG